MVPRQALTDVEILMTHESGVQDCKGNTALMYGARAGHFGCVELLASLESQCINSAGYTALMMAACGDFSDCVDALVDLEGNDRQGWPYSADACGVIRSRHLRETATQRG